MNVIDVAAESAGNVAYGAALQAVATAARAWRLQLNSTHRNPATCELVAAIDALNRLDPARAV